MTDIQIAKKMVHIAQSARARHISFDMSFRVVKRLLNTKRCYFTNVKFNAGGEMEKLSFDRIDNELGYTDDNVVVCTRRINCLKTNLTIKEIKGLARGIEKHVAKKKKK